MMVLTIHYPNKYYLYLGHINLQMEENLIIDFTPTGLIPTKGLTPNIPISVSEIIEDIHTVW